LPYADLPLADDCDCCAPGWDQVNSTVFWYATRASGIVALVLLTSTMVLGLTTTARTRTRNWPGFARQELHRRLAMISMVFLAIHVVTSILDTYVHIGWASVLVPFTSSYSRFWVGMGTVAVDLMMAVFVSSLLRTRMKPATWRGLHWLAYACWPVALAHTFGVGTDAGEPWVIALGASCILAVAAALLGRLRATAKRAAARPGGETEITSIGQPVLTSSAWGAGHGH
jgi:methionine sulfoxide reductase heme-binding subunit